MRPFNCLLFALFVILSINTILIDAYENVIIDDRENYYSIGAHINGDLFGKGLRKLVDELLSVNDFQKFISEELSSQMEPVTISNRNLLDIARAIDARFVGITRLLPNLVKNIASTNDTLNIPSCNSIHHIISSSTVSPCYVSHDSNQLAISNFTKVLNPILNSSAICHQFMFADSLQFVYPAEFMSANANLRLHWKDYLNAVAQPKHVILLVGLDDSISVAQLESFKAVLRHLIDMAGDEDRYRLIVVDNSEHVNQCGAEENWIKMNALGKKKIANFIEGIELPMNETIETIGSIHSLAISQGMDAIRRSYPISPITIQYISRGLLSELSESSQIMSKFVEGIRDVSEKSRNFKLNAIIVGDENRSPPPWSQEFFANLVGFHYYPYMKTVDNETLEELETFEVKPQKGQVIVVNQRSITSSLNLTILANLPANDSNYSKPKIIDDIKWSISRNNVNGKDLLTITQVISDSVIVGVDLFLSIVADEILVNDVIELAPANYDFELSMIDNNRNLIISSSSTSKLDVAMEHSEKWPKSPVHRKNEYTVINQKNGMYDYTLARLQAAPFTVVLSRKLWGFQKPVQRLPEYTRQRFTMNNMIWHQFEDDKFSICSRFGAIIAPRLAAVYLAPRAYRSFARHTLLPYTVRNNWVFLTDTSGYIRSNTLRSGVREDIGILSQLVEMWMKISVKAKGNPSIIRRYAATMRGTMVVFPAITLRDDYDPTIQKWFVSAVKQPGYVILSEPRRDELLGDVLTLSYAITAGNATNILAVAAMEFPSGLLSVVLNEAISSCGREKRCILFTSRGSVVYSDDRAEQARPLSDAIERFHLNHLEPQLATQMIRSQTIVRKRECTTDATTQRYYEWNTSYKRVFSVSCGDTSSSKMTIGPLHSETLLVASTNLFLSMINSSCSRAATGAFCPCSVKDKRCLLCGRFELADCECPCECARRNICDDESRLAICPTELSVENFLPPSELLTTTQEENRVDACAQTDCSQLLNPAACRSTAGCEWCRYSTFGSPLSATHCASISSCYQGVHKRTVMKSTSSTGIIPLDEISFSIPLGPFLACLLTVIIFVVLIFWYRKLMRRLVSRRPFDSSGVHLFSRNGQAAYEFDHDGSLYREAEKMALQLASFETQAPEVARRQPPPTVSSDHGYSTMTDRNTADGSDCCVGSFPEPRHSTKLTSIDKICLQKIVLDPDNDATTTSSLDETSEHSTELITAAS